MLKIARSCIFSKKKFLCLILCIFITTSIIFKNVKTKDQPLGFIVNTVDSICVIPDLDPFDSEVMKFETHVSPLNCPSFKDVVFVDNDGSLKYNRQLMTEKLLKDVQCFYALGVRRNGDEDVEFQPEVVFKDPVYIPAETFVVTCKNSNGKVIYRNLLHNIDYKTVRASKQIRKESSSSLSVLMFGIDSLSRLTAIRKLPKTMKYLENELGAYIFKGFTKIGINTRPNVGGMLTGLNVYKESPYPITENSTYDKYPFIWKNFSKSGYVTMFAEDEPTIAIFNYLSKGFIKKPCDHYLRPFFIAMKKVTPTSSFDDSFINYLRKSSEFCYGNKGKHLLLIEFYKRLLKLYKGERKFALSWLTQLTHENSYNIELADKDFLAFFKWLKSEGHLDNAVFMFISDHGPRVGKFRNTPVGRFEVNMPLVTLVLPEHFKKSYPNLIENIQHNVMSLATPYDTFEFLKDILHQRFDHKSDLISSKLPRGISLLQKIPRSRSCKEAGIIRNYCSCYTNRKLNLTNPVVEAIAPFLVKQINRLLEKKVDKCAILSLSAIENAGFITFQIQSKTQGTTSQMSSTNGQYVVNIETKPGRGLFEGVVDVLHDGSFRLVGDIDRTNYYGNQSSCIRSRKLEPYCYCK